ncbi:MAG TPA: CmcJ/NvfI family oxidoreductase [Burkholderiales bacterium]|nr:CmcJ/NvfI family oxidoreductase [Burkholderiales bacterium]
MNSRSDSQPMAAAAGATVEASLNYLADLEVKPVSYVPPQGTGLVRRVGNYAPFRVTIRDARPLAGELSLDRQGFVLVQHDTAVKDFYDDAEVRGVYYPEIERLVAGATGAEKVVVFDHTLRSADRAVERGLRTPVHSVHNDYTERSGPQRVRDLLDAAEAETRLARRFAEYNVWRPISGPVRMAPLALAEAGSIAPADLAVCDLVYQDRAGEIHQGVYNPAHRWYYFPEMQRHEAILIKCYDSMRDGRARFTLHSAFDLPTTPAGAPARESIEIRTFAFF